MTHDIFARVEPIWLDSADTDEYVDSIPLLSIVRVRRNVAGFPFPAGCKSSELYDSAALLLGCIGRSDLWNDFDLRMIDKMAKETRHLLVESGMISPLLARGGAGRFSLKNTTGTVACMINEEDHLSMTVMNKGLVLSSAKETLTELMTSIDVPLAQDAVLGCLTANPNYVGTGMTASVLLHLPAIDAAGKIPRVCAEFEKSCSGLALYKLLSDEKNGSGSFYLLANRTTLSVSEDEIVSVVTEAARALVAKESSAWQKMRSSRDEDMNDRFWRAWGLLRHARKLSFSEAVSTLSFVKLGSSLGILPHVGDTEWRRMTMNSQRYHLGLASNQIIERVEEPYVRASRFRQFIEARSASISMRSLIV